eukprot:COSAG02_NODE_43215_length_377_cov_0.557554_1_plen_37_part_01
MKSVVRYDDQLESHAHLYRSSGSMSWGDPCALVHRAC